MAIVGNLEKENGQRPGQYEWKSYRCRAMAVPGQDGKVYLSFGIDSGFERLSCYYLDSVDIAWEETQPLSRGRGHPDPVGESGPSHRGGGALPRHGEGRPLCRRAGLGPEPWHCPGLRRRQLPPGGEPQLAAGAVPPLPGHREPGGLLGAGAPRPGGLGAGRRRLGAGSGASAHPGAGRPCRPHSGGRVPADAPHGISGNRRGRGQISLSPGGFPEMGRQRRHRGGRRKGRKIPGRTGQGWPLQRGTEAVRTVQTRGCAAAMPPSRLCRDSSLCAKAPWPAGDGGTGGHVGPSLRNIEDLPEPTESVFAAVRRRGGTEPAPYTSAGSFCGGPMWASAPTKRMRPLRGAAMPNFAPPAAL